MRDFKISMTACVLCIGSLVFGLWNIPHWLLTNILLIITIIFGIKSIWSEDL
jgi:hypothetical protein